MKVLEAFGEPISYGGQESFVMNVVQNMDLTGLQIDLLTTYYCDNGEYRKKITSLGGKIFELKKEFRPGKSRFYLRDAINQFFQQNKYDVVHIHSGSTSMLAIYAYYAKKSGVKKVIVHSHVASEKQTLKDYILRSLCNKYMNDNADLYCACSVAAGRSKFMKDHVFTIVNDGIDLSRFTYNKKIRNAFREKLGLTEEKYVVGHVGRFSYQKNHSYLIDIFKGLCKLNPTAILLLVGTGELENVIKEKIRSLKLEEQVIFVGAVDNVNDYMQAMDCFVFPSKFEGLGMVAIEAQAISLPCFLSDVIPKEVAITNLVHFISLNKSPSMWGEVIMNQQLKKRMDMSAAIKTAGYDITDVATKIRNIYLK